MNNNSGKRVNLHKRDLVKQVKFLCEADFLKKVERRSFLLDSSRNENSAEHSWHVSLAALVLSEFSNQGIDELRVIKMLLVHDLVEIYAGDAFLYDDKQRMMQIEKEKTAAEKIFSLLPNNQAENLKALWLEFEQAETAEAKFAKSLDRFIPILHNYFNKGIGWKKNNITKEQVIDKNKIIDLGSQQLWKYVKTLLNKSECQDYFGKIKNPVDLASKGKILDMELDLPLKTTEGWNLKLGAYKTDIGGKVEEHALIYKGNITQPSEPVILRINSACYTGDIFHCTRCDCSWQLLKAMEIIEKNGGLIIYHFNHEGRGIGFLDKLKTYRIMDQKNKTTKEAFEDIGKKPDARDFYSSVLILRELGINEVKLLSNNPDKRNCLISNGIKVVEMLSVVSKEKSLSNYLRSKKEQFGHLIND